MKIHTAGQSGGKLSGNQDLALTEFELESGDERHVVRVRIDQLRTSLSILEGLEGGLGMSHVSIYVKEDSPMCLMLTNTVGIFIAPTIESIRKESMLEENGNGKGGKRYGNSVKKG